MDATDLLFSLDAETALKEAVIGIIQREYISNPALPILTPTDTNDDVNGSQHVSNGGTDFTYRDATAQDLLAATSIGYYEYFSRTETGYTGIQYNGDGRLFPAIVINPPAYAIDTHL